MINLMVRPSITYMVTTDTDKCFIVIVDKNTPVHVLIDMFGGEFIDKKWTGSKSKKPEKYKIEALDIGVFKVESMITHRKSENKSVNSDGTFEILGV